MIGIDATDGSEMIDVQNESVICSKCGQTFDSNDVMKRHEDAPHDTDVILDQDHAQVIDTNVIQDQVDSEESVEVYDKGIETPLLDCKICGKRFKSLDEMKDHGAFKHCEICGQLVEPFYYMHVHCDFCNKTFKNLKRRFSHRMSAHR